LYSSLALGFLAKGPIAWTPLLTLAAMKLFVGDVELAKRFKFARGILLMLAIVALWGVPALIQTHGEFFRIGIGRHVVGRSFGAMEGHGANSLGIYLLLLPFYFVTIFASSIYLVVARFVTPTAARFFPAAQLFTQTSDQLRPEMEFGAVDFQEPSLVWYFRSRVHGWMTPLNATTAVTFMGKSGPRF